MDEIKNESLQGADFSDLETLTSIDNTFDFLQKGNDNEIKEVENSIDSQNSETNENSTNESTIESDSAQTQSTDNSAGVSELIEAKTLIDISDMVFSRLGALACQMGGKDAKYTDFKLDSSEKKVLEKPLQEVINKHGWGGVSPETKLVVLLIGMYGFKVAKVLETAKPKVKENKNVSRETVEKSENIDAPYGYLLNGKPRKTPKNV
jgi:hypothetical protein